jgi:tetratricopeptide (TPR) repeat protein
MLSRRSLLFLSKILAATVALTALSACGSPEQKAQGYYDQAAALIAKDDYVQARKSLLTSLKYKSDKIETWRLLAVVDERAKAVSALFQDLHRIVELDPKDNEARLKLASIMVAGGAADAAQKLIETIDDGDKPNAALHALKASILMRQHDLSGAVREAQRAVEIDPGNVDATVLLAAKKIADGDGNGALHLLDGLPDDRKTDSRVQLERVQAYIRVGDTAQAEAALRKLVSDNPSVPGYRNELVRFLIASKHFDEAEKELRAIATASPKDSKAELDLVKFLVSWKGTAAGRAELDACIKAGGDVFDYQIARAEIDVADGHFNEAIDQFKALVKVANTTDRKVSTEAKLAEVYVRKSDFAAAEPVVADVLQQDKNNVQALKLRAALRLEQGNFDAAIADLRQALTQQPKSVDVLLLLAAAYERGGKNELADRQYADALKASNQNLIVAQRYVGFLQRRGDLSHAENVLLDVATRDPTNIALLTSLAQIRLSRQDWSGVMAVAAMISKLNGGAVTADEIRAAAFAGQKRFDDSISALEAARAAAPKSLQPVVNLVSTYIRLGKTDKASDLLRDAMKQFPDNAEALVLLGQVQMAQNKPNEAEQTYKLAIEKQPKDVKGYLALSEFYAHQKNYKAAIGTLQAGLQALPGNLNFRFLLAGLHIQAGESDEALAEYEAILKDQPGSLLAVNNVVSLILDNSPDKASLDKALAMADRLKGATAPQLQDTYGWAEFKRGNIKDAIATLEAAKSKMPNNAVVRYHLGMSYLSNGDVDKAQAELKAASDLEPDGTQLKKNILSAMKRQG